MISEFFDPTIFSYVVLPILIFFARICDVTFGTIRVIFVARGEKYKAPIVGFIEVFIWIIVISELLSSASNLVCYIAYAAGFATGNFVGMLIEERLAIGMVFIRAFVSGDGHELTQLLNSQGFGTTIMEGEGSEGTVHILHIVASRKLSKNIERILNDYNPNLFYVIEDVRSVRRGIFPSKSTISRPGK